MTNDDVSAIDGRIQRVGSTMLFAEPVLAVGAAAGIDDALLLYAGGRGGVLGSVPWQQIHSAFAFFPPEIVETTWTGVLGWGEPASMAKIYAEGFADFGRCQFGPEEAATIAELGAKVAASVTPMGYPLFAGWRDMERPGDARADAALAIMTLRELRGDIHVQDIAAAGIHPLQAEIVVRGDGAALHGWQPPYPEAADHEAAVLAATATTTARMARIYGEGLSATEWSAFSDAVLAADA